MPGLPAVLFALAQAVNPAAPAEAGAPRPAATAAETPAEECSPKVPDPKSTEIVICAEKPLGYRLNPDVMKARKELRSAGRPTRPGPIAMKDNSCTVVGPAPCINAPMINLLAAVATLAEMSERLSKGKEVGSMFITDPHPDEYHLYLQAKAEREAKEEEEAAKLVVAKAKAAAAAEAAAVPKAAEKSVSK
jgi:hypothetical protein